jgi:hypothetical protein
LNRACSRQPVIGCAPIRSVSPIPSSASSAPKINVLDLYGHIDENFNILEEFSDE